MIRRPRWPFVLGLIIVGLVLAISLSGCVVTPRKFWNDPERMKDAFHVTNGLDAASTIARDRDCTIERSLVLGNDPPPEKVAIFAIAQSIGIEWLWPHLSQTERLWVARIGTVLHFGAAANNTVVNSRGCP